MVIRYATNISLNAFTPWNLIDIAKLPPLYDRIIRDFGFIDIVINNAGVGFFIRTEITYEVNLVSVSAAINI